MVRFRKREFRHGRVELQLETLQEDRMIDAPVRPAPAQDAIAQDEIHAFRFAIDATVERVKGFEDFHRRASGLFGFYPLIARKLPTLQGRRPTRIVCELRNPRLCAILRFLQSLLESETVRRVIPPIFQPCGNFLGRFRCASQPRALHFQNVTCAAVFRTLAVPVFCFQRAGLRGASLNGRMLGEIAEPQTPGLFVNLPFRGIAVLVQRFQIAEHACEFVACDAEFIGIHSRCLLDTPITA